MDRRKREQPITTPAIAACAVCGVTDERMLAIVQLRGGDEATLCGSHALMHARSKADLRTVEDLRIAFGERRRATRRNKTAGGDELAERLSAAFRRERRAG